MNCFQLLFRPLARNLTLLLVLIATGSVIAQEPAPSPTLRRGVWEAEMPAGGYIVRLAAITSVSQHEYVVDGAARVTEVNIATTGSELVRFYYIEPNTPMPSNGMGQSVINQVTDKAEAAADKIGQSDLWKKVIKNYPMTTHARTIEYRLPSKEQLNKLFESVKQSWLQENGGVFKP